MKTMPMLDPTLLERYALKVYEEISRRRPRWLPYADIEGPEWESLKLPEVKSYEQEVRRRKGEGSWGLSVTFPPPVQGTPPLEILALGDELSVSFGSVWEEIHLVRYLFLRASIPDEVEAVEALIARLVMEELIAAEWEKKRDFITREKWKRLQDKSRLTRSWSWLGNFNFPEVKITQDQGKSVISFSPSLLFPYFRCSRCQTLLYLREEEIRRGEVQCGSCRATDRILTDTP